MKLSYKIDNVKQNNLLNIAFDVSKDDLHLYTQTGSGTIECVSECFANNLKAIKDKLISYESFAQQKGFSGTHIICEPTGGYEEKLLLLARQLGLHTSYVSGEAVHKYKIIEDNSASKSDIRDPRVIFFVAQYGKLLKHRILPDEYEMLRHFNRMHEYETRQLVSCKNMLHRELRRLFCDLSFNNAFLFGSSGRALLKKYHGNPYKIVRAGKTRFNQTMKKNVRGIRDETIEQLYSDASCSSKLYQGMEVIEILDWRVAGLYKMFEGHEQARKEIKQRMSDIYQRLLDNDEAVPKPVKGFVSQVNLARIIGETGPLGDFDHQRKLKRFGGLNLRERSSGQYKGKNKVAKKGRIRLRLILGQSIFHLIKRDRILGEYYHGFKERGMPGTKAMSVVARKLIEILFALSRPGTIFDESRLFVCESCYKSAA